MVYIRGIVRNSPWVAIAVIVHVIVFATLSIVYVASVKEKKEEKITGIDIAQPKPEEVEPEIKPEEVIDRTSIPKPANVEAEVTTPDRELALSPDMPVGSEQDLGGGSDFSGEPSGGTALGVGAGPGLPGGRAPSPFGPGRGKGGGGLGTKGGATQKTQEAVLYGMLWLARHQAPDGSWSVTKLRDLCQPPGTCGKAEKAAELTDEFDEGLTALCTLVYLGAGYAHDAKQSFKDPVRGNKKILIGDIVRNALKYLRDRQAANKDGRFSKDGHIYNEALATMAMCEAYGMTDNKQWRECAKKGVEFLLKAQRRNPSGTGLWGWRYQSREFAESEEAKKLYDDVAEWERNKYDSDISVTAWVVMAMKSAEIAGFEIPEEAWRGALDFTNAVTNKEGRVTYQDIRKLGMKITGAGQEYDYHETSMAALGMCVRIFAEKNIDDPILALSAQRIVKDLPVVSKNRMSVDYYYWYYASMALNQYDGDDSPKRTGKYWKPWNAALVEVLTSEQDLTTKSSTDGTPTGCSHGSWPIPDRWSLTGGPIYRTAINVLTLEVYYRYQNAFGAENLKRKEKKVEQIQPDDK